MQKDFAFAGRRACRRGVMRKLFWFNAKSNSEIARQVSREEKQERRIVANECQAGESEPRIWVHGIAFPRSAGVFWRGGRRKGDAM
ncbi:MAG TPA: hypothetical protein PK490_07980, partial [Prosthecobacter sp.]|nr:hypothetical protein [Prosthecobacter sp.]